MNWISDMCGVSRERDKADTQSVALWGMELIFRYVQDSLNFQRLDKFQIIADSLNFWAVDKFCFILDFLSGLMAMTTITGKPGWNCLMGNNRPRRGSVRWRIPQLAALVF